MKAIAALLVPSLAFGDPISIMMDRGDDGVRADATVTLVPAVPFSLRADVYLQYVDPRFHVGGYATMPFEIFDRGDGEPTYSAFGNLELGALYVAHVLPELRVVARAGVVLPTYNDPNAIGGDVLRLTDWVDGEPELTALRFSASPIYRRGQFFARADIGFDRGPTPERTPQATSFVRVNAAVGFATDHFALSIESVNLYATNGPFVGNEDSQVRGASWRDEVAFGGQYKIGIATPYLALVVPADHDMQQSFSVAVTIGCDVRLR
jgi:hypothetical protein